MLKLASTPIDDRHRHEIIDARRSGSRQTFGVGGYRFVMQTHRNSGEFRYDSAVATRPRSRSEVADDAQRPREPIASNLPNFKGTVDPVAANDSWSMQGLG